MRSLRPKAGFTLIEFLLAMALFAFFIAIMSSLVIFVFHIHQNGLATRRTQQAARQAVEEIERLARGTATFADKVSGPERLFCLYPPLTPEGDVDPDSAPISGFLVIRFRAEGVGYPNGTLEAAIAPPNSTCAWSDTLTGRAVKLVPGDLNVVSLGIAPSDDGRIVRVTLRVASANRTTGADLFVGGNPANGCKPGFFGNQSCSVTLFRTSFNFREERL